MGKVILNCDLGENESQQQTQCLMALLDAANICCGAHAGNLQKTAATLKLAKRYQVMVGAHPGLTAAGGRGSALPSAAEFRQLLEEQLGSFLRIATELEVRVRYVKLHGTLYHAVETNDALAEVFLSCIKSLDTELGVFCLAGGRFAERARAVGLIVWEELFADRAYTKHGGLVARSQAGAVIETVSAAVERLCIWLQSGAMPTEDGGNVTLTGDTLCVHADSPNALDLLKALRVLLD